MPAATASIGEALAAAVDGLSAAGVESPRLEAELLLAEASGVDRARLAAEPGAPVDPGAARSFGELVRRRLRREPVPYILGRRGFRHVELAVDRRVLIPRPETELLVELALESRPSRVLDIGTGSGAVALAVADELPGCEVVATDTSPAALEVARANAERLGLSERVEFHEGTLPSLITFSTSGVENVMADGGFDLILSNPPYIADAEWPSLAPEITRWEPREALLAGPEGLDAYRSILEQIERCFPRHAGKGALGPAVIGLEVGEGQAGTVAGMLAGLGLETETRRDLAGIERLVIGRG